MKFNIFDGIYYDVLMQDMLGKVFTEIQIDTNTNEIRLICNEGTFVMYHSQDCCEHVSIDSIIGDLEDLVGNFILFAEESSHDDPDASDSGTWTFYKFATIKGYVDIRWYGSSNGYYSERVDIKFIPNLGVN